MEVERWAKELPFLPTSSQQVLKYLKYKKYAIPKNPRTKKASTGAADLELLLDALEKVGKTDPVLEGILHGRKLTKGIGYLYDTYLGRDGRMHPEATLFPETGRLSYRRPNFQNQPSIKRTKAGSVEERIALAIRHTVVASPGCTLIEFDWNSIEALLLAYFAKDPDYARISLLGAHAFLLSHYLGKPADLSWDDKRLKGYLDGLKKEFGAEYQICKIANLGDSYDIGVRKLAKVLKSTQKEAQGMKDLRKAAFPKIAAWQMETRLRAHGDGKLVNPFNYTGYFWNVFEKRKDGKWAKGQQAHEVLAFLPQSTNAMMLRQTILELAAMPGYGEWFWLLVPIHDALLLECVEGREKELMKIVRELMTRKWAELEGLSIGVDIVEGKNWGDMQEGKEDD